METIMNKYSSKFLCKYKPLSNPKDFDYTIDILQNNRFYLSSIRKLNDVFECPLTGFQLSVSGSGIYASQGLLHPIIEDKLEKYRILSLTEDYLNEVMWAHYTSNYNGVCIVVSNNTDFKDCKRVKYLGNEVDPDLNEENLDEIIRNSLFFKNSGWMYEKEYRIIKEDNYGDYFYFNKSSIICLIIGHNLNIESFDFYRLQKAIEELNIKIYKTYINRFDGRLSLVNINFEPVYDGSKLDEIFI